MAVLDENARTPLFQGGDIEGGRDGHVTHTTDQPWCDDDDDTADDAEEDEDEEYGNERHGRNVGAEGEEDYWTVRVQRFFNRAPPTPNAAGLLRRVSVDPAASQRRRANNVSGRESHKAKVAEIESFEYFPGDSSVYREWLSKQPIHRRYDRWLMMLFVGLSVGLMGRVLYAFINALTDLKYATLHRLLSRRQLFLAWLFSTVYSGALAFLAAYPVAFVAPAAAASGVPEVMAYLNGCNIPKVFDVATFAVKFVSTMCSVASGLPVGAEGPMIHLGAMVGAGVSQGDSSALGFFTPCALGSGVFGFGRFRNEKDKRDFITAGAACGVAVAFGAPIGGLLFAYEEVTSHWRPSLAMLTFFACMTALFTDTTLASLQQAVLRPEMFGAVSPSFDTAFEVNRKVTSHLLSVFPAAAVGVVAGGLAAAFTACNLAAGRLRQRAVGSDKRRQVIEPVVIMVTYAMIALVLPMAFPCTSSGCVLDDDGASAAASYPPGVAPSSSFSPGSEAAGTGASGVGGGGIFCEGGSEHLHRVVEQSMLTFTCRSHRAEGAGNSTTETKDYNELATLLHVSSDDAIRHLLTRGTHREFGYGPLLTFLLVYLTGAVVVAGSSVASGLFVPMLVIGAAVGRLVGLLLVDIAAGWGYTAADLAAGGAATAWVDPGVFALLGAGAFMGGVTRLCLSLAVIIMEMSGEQHFLLPILLGIVVAKWTADALHKPLYHALLEVKHAPFLPDEPAGAAALHLHDVSEVMRPAPLTTLRERERVSALRHALRHTTHQGFPVVRPTDGVGDVLVGMVSRPHLKVLLRAAAAQERRRRGGGAGGGGGRGDARDGEGRISGGGGPGDGVGGGGGEVSGGGRGVSRDGTSAPSPHALRRSPTPRPVTVRVGYEELDRRVSRSDANAHSLVEDVDEFDRTVSLEAIELSNLAGDVRVDAATASAAVAAAASNGGGGGEGGGGVGGGAGGEDEGADQSHAAAGETLLQVPDALPGTRRLDGGGEGGGGGLLDLSPYLNRSAPRVPHTCSVSRAYDMFRSLGLRHICVVDECNRVVGIVTRKELLDDWLEERLDHLGHTLTGFRRRRSGAAGG